MKRANLPISRVLGTQDPTAEMLHVRNASCWCPGTRLAWTYAVASLAHGKLLLRLLDMWQKDEKETMIFMWQVVCKTRKPAYAAGYQYLI